MQLPGSGATFLILLHFPGLSNLTWIILVQVANGLPFHVCRARRPGACALTAGHGSAATRPAHRTGSSNRPPRGKISPFTGAPMLADAGYAQRSPGR